MKSDSRTVTLFKRGSRANLSQALMGDRFEGKSEEQKSKTSVTYQIQLAPFHVLNNTENNYAHFIRIKKNYAMNAHWNN